MKKRALNIVLLTILLKLTACKPAEEPRGQDNIAYKWGKIALELTANDTERFRPRPTVTSRYLGLVFTAIFDAWSRFDKTATPVYLTKIERISAEKQTLRNKEIAISYAAFRALNEYFYADSLLIKEHMIKMGFDPNNTSLDANTPEGIGNLAAKAVIEARRKDGSNQYGEELELSKWEVKISRSNPKSDIKNPKYTEGGNSKPFFDYTNYQPINTPDKNTNINRWQPKYFADGKGGKFAPTCLTPFWGHVKPISLTSGDQFRPPPPPLVGSEQLEKEVKEVVELQAHLTNEQKALVEFMRDGPKSVQQAGHWLLFAQDISIRDKHTLDEDVKMYFLTEITAMDAFIAAWDAKIYYDFARPFALVHHYFKDKKIRAWGGEGKGTVEMQGQNWRPYSPETFVCPAFPSYVSGHSCVSAACGEALRLFKNNDTFGKEVRLVPGKMTEPNHLGDTVTIKFPTFTETANMAGLSRVLGGYHIQADNLAGLALGRNVAKVAWENYKQHLGI
jgi:PAP2 superfamily